MSKANLTPGERPYHHGDLHRAIVNAALEVLSETQSTEFSLRELARRAGVTHNAPYKHFADKRELLAAVSAVGFDLLAKRLSHAMQGQTSPRARLFAIARDYVRHGVENPALYRLMFGGYLTGPDDAPPCHRNCRGREDEGPPRGCDRSTARWGAPFRRHRETSGRSLRPS